MEAFLQKYSVYQTLFEEELSKFCEQLSVKPDLLKESMVYSLKLGGKRVRPVIMLATADMLGVDKEKVLPYALAIEMIHTYSLIHDDLPAMDNDDFRRGKPSNHKVFGEANAILAGDALLNEALTLAIKQCFLGEAFIKATLYLSECAGANGMISGQSADLYFSAQDNVSESDLEFIDKNKTGKLLLAPVMIPAILAEYPHQDVLEEFGKEFGKLFQWTDDLLDVEGDFTSMGKTLGKDEKANKLTCVSLYGLGQAKLKTDECKEKCLSYLARLTEDTAFLRDFVIYIRNRKH